MNNDERKRLVELSRSSPDMEHLQETLVRLRGSIVALAREDEQLVEKRLALSFKAHGLGDPDAVDEIKSLNLSRLDLANQREAMEVACVGLEQNIKKLKLEQDGVRLSALKSEDANLELNESVLVSSICAKVKDIGNDLAQLGKLHQRRIDISAEMQAPQPTQWRSVVRPIEQSILARLGYPSGGKTHYNLAITVGGGFLRSTRQMLIAEREQPSAGG